eukprot:9116188-Pyramimonas_sp.AAC.1
MQVASALGYLSRHVVGHGLVVGDGCNCLPFEFEVQPSRLCHPSRSKWRYARGPVHLAVH